ncbi:adhesion G protein-coupled receptor F4-like [Hippoglossus hippoglossus]|uniref:adhesion G protein-coupled receptor F4-like n=1 Tax=Hippoglossus hippoglossus TaxID=8267 RepID=UPI00148DB282|nr:adhesion G protein-coupled receptor F4-like [Hippoglossus hippoglossus]
MESQIILSLLKKSVQVNGSSDNVAITEIKLVSECFLIGDTTSCNCSGEYSWSNEVCYSSSCCTETTCTQNVSHIKPLCIAKVQVYINGSVTLTSAPWDANKTAKLETAFRSRLNGYESLNITGYSNKIADFEAAVSIKLKTFVLQKLLTDLDDILTAKVLVDTVGMVNITAPEDRVCYKSSPSLECRLEEATTSTGWKLIKEHKHLELEDGSMVTLNRSCFDGKNKSCIAVTLNKVTSAGSGTYQCRFTFGSVTHTAKAQLNVSLLPEVITMTIDPPVADCSVKTNVKVTVTAKIQNTTESYKVSWELNGSHLFFVACPEDTLVYSVKSNFLCEKMTEAKWKVIFQNQKGQMKNESVDILVISENGKYCPETDGIWPKTPNGGTVINQTCENGKTGYKSRTCNDDSTWQPVFSFCISQKLQKVQTAAEMILFQDFLYAASNLLKNNWTDVNSSIRQDMSSQYLEGVEDLVKNIQVNNTLNISRENLDLKVSRSDCNISVFNVTVKLYNNPGKFKTVGVRNLLNKFDNRFQQKSTALHNLIIITTIENSSFPTEITMDFPIKQLNHTQPHCVFWDTNKTDWSETGCKVQPSDANHTRCNCTHLTSFAVLMSKTDTSDVNLDTITYVGLAVSICSLLIFLIIEALVWSVVVKTNLSYFRHTALVNIAVFLLLADCSFLGSISPEKLSPLLCLILTICKHVFYLATFSWMLCMSVMLIHRLIFVFSPLRKKVFMFLSSIVGYACPVLIVALSYVYCKYNKKRYYEEKTCWLVFEGSLEGSIYAFLLPVGTVIFTNLFSMAVVIFTLLKSSAPDSSRSDEKETAKSIIKVVVFLTPVFGVTWGIGFLLLIFEQDHDVRPFLNYSFTILNSFQGFFVMLTGVFAEPKVRQELLKRMDKGKYDTMKNSTSASNTKER